jgi:hypothetical protein
VALIDFARAVTQEHVHYAKGVVSCFACKEKKEEAAALLMEATKNAGALDVQDTNCKRSALHYASSSGLESSVAKLLSLGADVALEDKCGKTALDVATNDEVKAALRQHGAKHSLFYAAEEGMFELVADLIKEGADVNEENEVGRRALELAKDDATFEALKAGGATKDMTHKDKNLLLLRYVEEGLTGGVLMALQAGADANHKDWSGALQQGKTVLDVATNDEVKAALRQHGAKHSLFYAAEEGMFELVADLIKEGADVNEETDSFSYWMDGGEMGKTSVERAKNAQTFEVLKAAGATMPEIPDDKKNCALLEYVEEGLTGGVLVALQAGADANHKEVCRLILHRVV